MSEYMVEIKYSDQNFPLLENLIGKKGFLYGDSTSGYLRDGICIFDDVTIKELKEILLKASSEAYKRATQNGKRNFKVLRKKHKSIFSIYRIKSIEKFENIDSEKEKGWFLARMLKPNNYIEELKSKDWIKEIYLMQRGTCNIGIRWVKRENLTEDSISSELSKLCGEPLEREMVMVFNTFSEESRINQN